MYINVNFEKQFLFPWNLHQQLTLAFEVNGQGHYGDKFN